MKTAIKVSQKSAAKYQLQREKSMRIQSIISFFKPVNETLLLSLHVVIQEKQIDPPVFPTELSFLEVHFIPKWTTRDAIEPRCMHQNRQEQKWDESDVSVEY
jgi:hypothetical protein